MFLTAPLPFHPGLRRNVSGLSSTGVRPSDRLCWTETLPPHSPRHRPFTCYNCHHTYISCQHFPSFHQFSLPLLPIFIIWYVPQLSGIHRDTTPSELSFFPPPPPPTAKRKGITMLIAWKLTTPTMQSNGQMVQEDKRQQITIVPVKRPRGAQSYPALLNNRYLAPKLCISFAHFPHSKIKQSKPLYSGKKIVFSISISFLRKKKCCCGLRNRRQ